MLITLINKVKGTIHLNSIIKSTILVQVVAPKKVILDICLDHHLLKGCYNLYQYRCVYLNYTLTLRNLLYNCVTGYALSIIPLKHWLKFTSKISVTKENYLPMDIIL